jgi:membrane-bound acyltransferase YfiQ involved in biofilm formation
MIFARFKDGITAFFNRHYKVILVLTIILLIVTFYVQLYTLVRYGYYDERMYGKYGRLLTLLAQMLFCLVFTTFVLLLNMKITIGNRVLTYISGISIELYLIHGFFVERIFGNVKMGDVTRFAVVIACSIACTAIVSPAIKWLVKKVVPDNR